MKATRYETVDGLIVEEKNGDGVIIHDPSVNGHWSFSNEIVARRVHRALDEWFRLSRKD